MNRLKDNVPNLGEFLVLLAISETYSWDDLKFAFLCECFDRNVRWVLKKYPQLVEIGALSVPEEERILKTFDASIVSLRLIMFQVYFMQTYAKPKGKTIPEIEAYYDRHFGKPSNYDKERLQKECFAILKTVKNFDDFFLRVGYEKPPTQEYLARWLTRSLMFSSRKRYHSYRFVVNALEKIYAKKRAEQDRRLHLYEQWDQDIEEDVDTYVEWAKYLLGIKPGNISLASFWPAEEQEQEINVEDQVKDNDEAKSAEES